MHLRRAIFLAQFCPRNKGAMRLTLCGVPNRDTRPDHNTHNYVACSLRLVCDGSSLTYPDNHKTMKKQETRPYLRTIELLATYRRLSKSDSLETRELAKLN